MFYRTQSLQSIRGSPISLCIPCIALRSPENAPVLRNPNVGFRFSVGLKIDKALVFEIAARSPRTGVQG